MTKLIAEDGIIQNLKEGEVIDETVKMNEYVMKYYKNL